MDKKDLTLSFIIGGAVGILFQPILSNFSSGMSTLASIPLTQLRVIAFFVFLFGAPAALFVFHFFSRFAPVLYQFAKFASVGVLNTTVDLGVFNLETFLYGSLPGAFIFSIFKAISFIIGTTNSFIWNKYWTFGANATPRAGEVVKFYAIAIIGGFLNVGVATAVRTANFSFIPPNVLVNLVAPMCGILAVFMWNFIGYKYVVFKKFD
ncbi:MAG TPA: GtrA family protein [Candidatus Paceibacterota bacterium]|nr:GtrA family protein [Candidatus Paceibacterota bacterium]